MAAAEEVRIGTTLAVRGAHVFPDRNAVPLGQRGSWAPTALNVLQCLGWATFELIIIATAAAALSEELFGVSAQALWTVGFGAVAALLR